jgi:hypothetical protein
MNERIKELAEQCQIEEYNQFGDLVEFGLDAEKFAELLIRECAMIAQLQDSDCVVDVVDYNSGRTWAGIDILKHFGI